MVRELKLSLDSILKVCKRLENTSLAQFAEGLIASSVWPPHTAEKILIHALTAHTVRASAQG